MKLLAKIGFWLLLVAAPLQAEELQLYFVHNDHLGTPVVVTDSAQMVVWQAEKTPFGETTETINSIEQPLRFPGQYFDKETGLHYNYFRDYDPGLGRYVQSDPIGLAGGINTYGYVYGNPLKYSDFYGLDASLYTKDRHSADPSDLTPPSDSAECEDLCKTYTFRTGPLSRPGADRLNTNSSTINNLISTGVGLAAGTASSIPTGGTGGGTIGTAVGLATGELLNRTTKIIQRGDELIVETTVCPSSTSDSGYSTSVVSRVIRGD